MVVANHALVMAAMESEAVLPDPKNLLLVLDEGHHLPDVGADRCEMSAEITAQWYRLQTGFVHETGHYLHGAVSAKAIGRWRSLNVAMRIWN